MFTLQSLSLKFAHFWSFPGCTFEVPFFPTAPFTSHGGTVILLSFRRMSGIHAHISGIHADIKQDLIQSAVPAVQPLKPLMGHMQLQQGFPPALTAATRALVQEREYKGFSAGQAPQHHLLQTTTTKTVASTLPAACPTFHTELAQVNF